MDYGNDQWAVTPAYNTGMHSIHLAKHVDRSDQLQFDIRTVCTCRHGDLSIMPLIKVFKELAVHWKILLLLNLVIHSGIESLIS